MRRSLPSDSEQVEVEQVEVEQVEVEQVEVEPVTIEPVTIEPVDIEPVDIDFGAAVLEVVDSIPPGSVLTYGDVAALLGTRAARAVGTVMARSGGRHPWWRVVRAGGHPPRGLERDALPHYTAEKTPLGPASTVVGYRVDYAVARWNAVLSHLEPAHPLDNQREKL